MITLSKHLHLLRCTIIAAALAAFPLVAHAAPNAQNDNRTSSPIDKDETLVIPAPQLLINDSGTSIAIKSVATSTQGAEVTWDATAQTVTYRPFTSETLRALDTGDSLDDTFTYTIEGPNGPDSTATVTVRVNGKNSPPVIAGIPPGNLTTDDKDTTNTPLAGIIISDPDPYDILTVTVEIDPAANGTFTNADDFDDNGDGTYTFTGLAADATTAVAALNFVPTENRITPGASDDTEIIVTVDDNIAPTESGSRTITILSVNDAPVVTPGANRNMNDNATLAIFSNVVLTDPDVGQTATVTVTFNSEKGEFSGSGFTLGGSPEESTLTISSANIADAQAALRALIFTPEPNQVPVDDTETLTFSIRVYDGMVDSNIGNLNVIVLSINDAPILAPPTVGPFSVSSGSTVTPFANITVTDVDFDDTTPDPNDIEAPNGDPFTATITLSPAPTHTNQSAQPGEIVSSAFTGSAGGPYTFIGTRLQVENAIQAARYLAPGVEGPYRIALSVKDSSGKANDTSNTVTATANVLSPVPGMSGLVAGQSLFDNSVIFPFASASFNNFGGFNRLVEITLDNDAKGSFDILGPFVKTGNTYSMTGDSVSATDAIRNLRFRPSPNRIIGASEIVTFTVLVKPDGGGDFLSKDELDVTVTPFNDAPTITGLTPEIRINDDQTAIPFANLTVADVDENGTQQVTVSITLIGQDPETNAPKAGGGTILDPPTLPSGTTFTTTGTTDNYTYTIVGTPANVTTVLRALVFTPTADRNAVGERETVRFTLFADDLKGGTAQNQNATVIVTSVNGAPIIHGIPPLSQQPFPVPASGNNMAMPFAGLSVTDKDASISFSITLDNPLKGDLSGGGFTFDSATNIYSFTGSPEEVTTALQALTYTIDPTFSFPADLFGLTTFTLSADDTINTTVRNFTIFIRERNVAHIVTSTADDGAGTLREAVDAAGNGDMIVFDFPADDFPVTLALESPIPVTKNLSIIGSGVDQLTVSGQNLTGIFTVTNAARLTIEQLTLKHGNAPAYGGAVSVDVGGALIARYCEFSNNNAGQFGGAIDIYQGQLTIENCLFTNNSVSTSTAKAGGAISIYSEETSSITNTTFFENRQENGGGDGGGAIYAENSNLAEVFNLHINHCTFLDNEDEKSFGTAILSASAGGRVNVRNNLFADKLKLEGQVLDVIGGGRIISLGGNIATDATDTTYTVNALKITLLDHLSDRRSTDPLLDPLARNFGATRTCALRPGSPAIGTAVAYTAAPGTDQRGYWRSDLPRDIGAFQTGTFKRININEIHATAGVGTDFIEFYNPRDSDVLDIAGIQLWIDGTLHHTFTTQTLIPGSGFALTSPVDLDSELGSIELRSPTGQRILLVDYIASFAKEGAEIVTTGESINRYPRYEGGFLPHLLVATNITRISGGLLTSPDEDVDGSPLGGGNATPIAVADVDESLAPIYFVSADKIIRPDILANDIDFDRTDTLKITEIMPLVGGIATNLELLVINGTGTIALANLPPGLNNSITALGAAITIDDDDLGFTYDPTNSDVMIGLAQGETITDIWAYTILDHDFSDTPQSRGADAAKQEDNIVKATAYFAVTVTGVNEAPEPQDKSLATFENQPVRLLGDVDLLGSTTFNFGDLPANFLDRDAAGNVISVLPPSPTIAVLADAIDVDSDDDNTTLLLAAVHKTEVYNNSLTTTSELGATVTLDIRAAREETNILYDPRSSSILDALADGEPATDSFYYSVVDRHGAIGTAKVTINITGVNDVPMANDVGGFITNQNAALEIPGTALLSNVTDVDGNDVLTIVVPFAATSSLGAALTFDGTTVTYDPTGLSIFEELARNESTIDTFIYSVTDSNGGISSATVTLLVEGRNDAPIARDDLLKILENQTANIPAATGLLANDSDVDINGSDPDDDPWIIPQRGVISPLGAALNINPDGSYTYDANSPAIDSLKQGELAVEIFPYILTDNFRTTALDDHFRIPRNSADVVLPVLLNDVVVGTTPNPILSYSAGAGTLVIESPNHALRNGLLVRIEGYTGGGTYNGVYPITSIDRNHFSVPVPFVDDPTATRGTWIPWFTITDISPGDNGGSITSTDGQTITYTPRSDFFGLETFTYTIKDGVGGQDVAEVQIEVIRPGSNGFLSVSNDRFFIGMDSVAVPIDVLANDGIRPAGTSLMTIKAVARVAAATGTLDIIDGGKALAYTPAPSFTGTESFTYTVSGGSPLTATVTFQVADRAGKVDAAENDFFVILGSANNLLDVLANDAVLPTYPVTTQIIAVNGDPVSAVTSSNGQVSIADDMLSYTPPAATLTDTFNYTARDGSGATVTRTVRVRVVPVATDFFAIDDHFIVARGSGPVALPVLANDGVVNDPDAVITITGLGLGAAAPDLTRVSISGGQFILYTPPTTTVGLTETFGYEIGIGGLARRAANVTVTVINAFATLPDANPDFFHVAQDSGPHTLNVLANDTPYPAAGWAWKITSRTTPSHGGTLAIIDGGLALSYTPAAGFIGTETFSYAVSDGIGNSKSALVTVRVGSLLPAPDHFAVLENSPAVLMPVLANDNLLTLSNAHYKISAVTASIEGGVVSITDPDPGNAVLYTPPADFSGEDSFTYTLINSSGGTVDETVTVRVIDALADRDFAVLRVEITGVNDVPVIEGLANASITDKETANPFANITITDLDEGGNEEQTATVTYDPTTGTVDAPGMTLVTTGTYSVIGTPAEVTAALRAMVFTPFENLPIYIVPGQALVEFALTLTDGVIPTPLERSVIITVTGVNDPPEPGDDIAATFENQAIRLMADPDLLAPVVFDFGDIPADFQDFDAVGNPVTLLPPPPTVALLVNDDDPDADDDFTTLLIGAVHTTEVPTNLLVTTSLLGARVVLDIRADRRETNILYDPRSSAILDSLPEGAIIEDSFYYSVFDRHGARGIAKVTITVTGVNDVPMARDNDGFVIDEDNTLLIPAATLLANDTDPDTGEGGPGDELTIVDLFPATSTLGAILTFDGTNITFDPTTIPTFQSLARNESITDTFTYTATDSNGGLSSATVTVVVTGVNDAPVANDDLLEILENDTANVVAAGGLLSNDFDVDINGTDPDDDPWIIPQREVITPLGAALTINPDGSYIYDANSPAIDSLIEGELAVELFPYILTDNFRTTASDDEFKVFASSTGVTLPVLLNDVVAGAPPTPVAGYEDDGSGQLVIESPNHELRDGLLIKIEGYQGDGAYNGVYAITSIGRDRFSIDVPFIDDPAATRGTWVPWLAITTVTPADKGGEITIIDGQALSYTPTPGFYGRETFTYAIRDGVGGQDVATVEIDVILPEFNGLVSASDDHFLIGMGSPATTVDVLSNDGILPDSGDYLTITDVAPLAGATGTLVIVDDGKALSYTPATTLFTGFESFTYTVGGSGPESATATVTFEVINRTGRLNASEDDFFAVAGTANNILDVLANDPVLPAYPVLSTIVAVNGNPTAVVTSGGGQVSIAGNKLSYTAPAAPTNDSFTYTARDASGATATRTVRVRVVPNSADFFASADHYIILAGTGTFTLPVLVNDGLVNEPGAEIGIINLGLDTNAPPDPERAIISNDKRSIQYTAAATAGTETFTYETSLGVDGDLRRRQALVTITIVEDFSMFPEAAPNAFHVAKNSGPHILDLLTNDIPMPDAGWRWEMSAVGTPTQGGQASLIPGTGVAYTPADGFYGIETFTYEIIDPFGNTDAATVTIRVGDMFTAPDHFAVLQDSPAITMPVLANDDLLEAFAADYTISTVTPASVQGGTVSIDGPGPDNAVRYTPPTGFTGEDSFGYTVIDKTGATRDEVVTVTVIPTDADRDYAIFRVEITGINDVPMIAGTADGTLTDKETINPFLNIAITDLDAAGLQQQTVTLTFDATFGTISAPGMTQLSVGVYRVIGTPAHVSAVLRAIVFTPFENLIDYIDPGQHDVIFNLSIDDGYVPTPVLHDTIITIIPINDAPTIITPIPDKVLHVNSLATVVNLLFHFADVDDNVPGGQLTWSATTTNPALFASVVTDQLKHQLILEYALDQPGVAEVTVRGTDRGGLFAETTFRITVEGPPVIVLRPGESELPKAVLITINDDFESRLYRDSFRVANLGTLPFSSFIVHVSNLDFPVAGTVVEAAEYTINENGTPNLYGDDTRSSVGVSIVGISPGVFEVKYNKPLLPGENLIVSLFYRVPDPDLEWVIRPDIRILPTTLNPTSDDQEAAISISKTNVATITFSVPAGKSYTLQYSENLADWHDWPVSIPSSSFTRVVEIVDDGSATVVHPSEVPRRFYRMAEVPSP